MDQLSRLGLIDVVAALLVLAAGFTSLRRRSGLLGAVGSGLAAALLVWLVVGAVATWGPPDLASAASGSRVAHVVPLPHHAFDQAGRLLGLHTPERNPR